MKKTISAITAFAITLTCASGAFAFTDVSQTDEFTLMEKLGIISGYSDGTFKPEEYLTRAEAAKMIAAINGYTDEAMEEDRAEDEGSEADFDDVDKNHWAYYYIKQGVLDGVISGFGDNTFRPDENVTWEQAVKMLVCAAGYETYAAAFGGYPSGYMMYGDNLGLFDNVTAYQKENITRGEIAEITAKTLEAPMCVITAWETTWNGERTPTLEIKDGAGKDFRTLLTTVFDVYEVTAEVTKIDDNALKLNILSAVNFDNTEITSNDDPLQVSVKLGGNDKSAFKKGEKYQMYIKVNNSTEKDYELVCKCENN